MDMYQTKRVGTVVAYAVREIENKIHIVCWKRKNFLLGAESSSGRQHESTAVVRGKYDGTVVKCAEKNCIPYL